MKDEASVEHPKVAEIRELSMWSEAQVGARFLCKCFTRLC